MLDQLEFAFGRYNGGQTAPIGSYLNPRTLAIQQLSADGALPQDGTWVRVDPSASQTLAVIASNVNAVLGTSYSAASFHTQGAGDLIGNPGQGGNDA
ncbi:hypothetical protein [Dictyobacter kobayashii]|uniref:Uncharacterized protein n=1 Tax=Dictyobacter kobayashii TaxID=2014872 RepID=A0A402AR89_9CHLR|nr:hypothetical protein [Dictyobacter kobayashii]GCE21612.1 hypothetical protein KDK_54120 [Dictyobacter kobayashii]